MAQTFKHVQQNGTRQGTQEFYTCLIQILNLDFFMGSTDELIFNRVWRKAIAALVSTLKCYVSGWGSKTFYENLNSTFLFYVHVQQKVKETKIRCRFFRTKFDRFLNSQTFCVFSVCVIIAFKNLKYQVLQRIFFF